MRILDSSTPACFAAVDPLAELAAHVGDDVAVVGAFVHRPGIAAHVHEHDRYATVGDEREHRRVVQARRHVVDELRAGVERGLGHDGLAGVDTDRNAERRDALDDGCRPVDLHVGRHILGPRTCRLASDVDEVGALRDHLGGPIGGGFHGRVTTAVAERVGRHVEDAHDDGSCVTQKVHYRLPWMMLMASARVATFSRNTPRTAEVTVR